MWRPWESMEVIDDLDMNMECGSKSLILVGSIENHGRNWRLIFANTRKRVE